MHWLPKIRCHKIIGCLTVAAVVTMLAVGEASRQKVLDRISSFGTNLMLIRPGAAGMRNSGDIATLVPADAEAIKALPNIATALPERNGRATARYGNIDYQTSVQGTGAEFPLARDWPVAAGQFFNADDMQHYATVVVLGKTVAKARFDAGAIDYLNLLDAQRSLHQAQDSQITINQGQLQSFVQLRMALGS